MGLTTIIFELILVLALITACAPLQKEEALGTEKEAAPTIAKKESTVVPTEVVHGPAPVVEYDEAVAELIEKGKEVVGYRYSFSSRKRDSFGNYKEDPGYDVYIKGDKIKKVYLSPVKLNGKFFFNIVYTDTAKQTANGVCVKGGVVCNGGVNDAYTLDYSSEKLELTPKDLLEEIPPEAKIVSGAVIDNRKASVLEYPNEIGSLVRLSIDDYYGLPVRYVIYKMEGDEEVLLRKYEFLRISGDNIKNADVTIPTNYQIVN